MEPLPTLCMWFPSRRAFNTNSSLMSLMTKFALSEIAQPAVHSAPPYSTAAFALPGGCTLAGCWLYK